MVEAGFEPQVHTLPTAPHRLSQTGCHPHLTQGSGHVLFPTLGHGPLLLHCAATCSLNVDSPGCPLSSLGELTLRQTPTRGQLQSQAGTSHTPSPTVLSGWPGPSGLRGLTLTVDMQDDVPAILAHCAHGHTGVAARVGDPGTGQCEDTAAGQDLRPQKEVHVRLCTSGASAHTLSSWPCSWARLAACSRPPEPLAQGNQELYWDSRSLLAGGPFHRPSEGSSRTLLWLLGPSLRAGRSPGVTHTDVRVSTEEEGIGKS